MHLHTYMYRYYWWRAVSASYFMRPNKPTLKLLSKYRTLPIKPSLQNEKKYVLKKNRKEKKNEYRNYDDNRQYISVYARRGVKGVEMEIRPFSAYTDAVDLLWKNTSNNLYLNNRILTEKNTLLAKKPVIFFGTEDPGTLKEAVMWGKEQDFEVLYTRLVDRSTLSAKSKTREGVHMSIYESICIHL
jgi:hypothetical protein